MFIYNRKRKLKINKKYYNVRIGTYPNNRISVSLVNPKENIEITLNLEDEYIPDGRVFLNPIINKLGILPQLKKLRIIREITGILNYNYVAVPVAILNTGILKKYDSVGMNDYLSKVGGVYE